MARKPITIGTVEELRAKAAIRKQKAAELRAKKRAEKALLPKPKKHKPGTERTGQPDVLPAFEAFSQSDFTETLPATTGTAQVPSTSDNTVISKESPERRLTLSPLRAIMAEEGTGLCHVPTERTRQGVSFGAGLGVERKVLAMILDIDVETLERLYKRELETATHLMMNDIQTNMYNIARDSRHVSSVKAGVYLLGKLGNRLYQEQRVAAQALTVNPATRTIDPSLLSDEQRLALKDILMAAMRLAQPGESSGMLVEGDYAEAEDLEDEDAEDVL